MKQYWIIIDYVWKERCHSYGDMVQRAFGYKCLGRHVEEVII